MNDSPTPSVTGFSWVDRLFGRVLAAWLNAAASWQVGLPCLAEVPGALASAVAAAACLVNSCSNWTDSDGTDESPLWTAAFELSGSARLSTVSRWLFCQKHRPNATASTARQTNSRERSSSRWSTMLKPVVMPDGPES